MTLARSGSLLLLCGAAFAAAPPANATLTISNSATKNVTCSAGVCTATAKNAVLNAGDLTGMLASSDVTVRSTNKAKDIELKVALSWASASRLTLDAYQSIAFDKPLTVAGPGALTLTTNDGGSGGELSFLSPGRAIFWDLSSSLVIDGANYTLVGDIATLASDIASDPSGHYALANTYDASVDGTYASSPIPTTFAGTFEGLGNAISHLTIEDMTDGEVALFAEVGSAGNLKSLALTGVSVNGGDAGVAPLASANRGTIFQASAGGVVSSDNISGGAAGLVATNFGTTMKSFATTKVSGFLAGGLVGENFAGTISQSFSTGRVMGIGYAGGLVGDSNAGAIDNSYAKGTVSAPTGSTNYVGGFAGVIQSRSSIAASYAAGIVKGGTRHLTRGAFAGSISFDNTFSDCYWDTTVSGFRGIGNTSSVSGIAGLTDDELKSGLPTGLASSIWGENSGINSGLPYLLANPAQ